jgi:flagellin-like protein
VNLKKRRDKKEMKILKSKKALSPVVASIILIAVTVAVSIAVAAWMGALTFTFMGTEQLEIQGCTFSGASGDAANTIVLTVQNTGTADLTVDKYKLGNLGTQYDITDVKVNQGATATITCTTGSDTSGLHWTSGTTYDIYLITSGGKSYVYRATAP